MPKNIAQIIAPFIIFVFTILVFGNYIFGAYNWISRVIGGECTTFIVLDICRSGGEK
jgi:hypothetical protein